MNRPPRYRLTDAEKDALLEEQAALIERMAVRIAELEAALAKPKKTSSNSHAPPSQDGPGRSNRERDPARRKKPRPSRPGVSRPLAQLEQSKPHFRSGYIDLIGFFGLPPRTGTGM